MFVPLTHNGVKGWIFNLVCPGNAMSVYHVRLLLLKNATVNRNLGFDDVCVEKHVYIAYNNEPPDIFEVNNVTGEMVEYEVQHAVSFNAVSYEFEIQAAFFKYNNIIPHWMNSNYTWGWYDNITNKWTGAVGKIESDEVDYAICCFGGTHARSTVAFFSPPLQYMPYHWLTRYPLELPPTWNLLGLFTKELKT